MKAQAAISRVMADVLTEFKALVSGQTELEVKVFGPKDDLANCHPPGIWWCPGDEGWSRPQQQGQPGVPGALWVREIPIHILIFGGDDKPAGEAADDATVDESPTTDLKGTDNTEWLLEAVINAFHRRLSHNGYQVASGGWGEATRTGMGQAYDLTITLRLPLVRIDNPTVKLQGMNVRTRLPSDGP